MMYNTVIFIKIIIHIVKYVKKHNAITDTYMHTHIHRAVFECLHMVISIK